MSSELQELYKERLGRYTVMYSSAKKLTVCQSAFGTTYFATKHMGYTYQQVNYDPEGCCTNGN
jgi:hypothetical protein